jgi:glucose/arabinose dehydrogenase
MSAAPARVALAAALAAATFAPGAPRAQKAGGTYGLAEVFGPVTFRKPVDLQTARDGSGRLFVVEQAGVIQSVGRSMEVATNQIFLDIRGRVSTKGNEMGLLGLAFSPRFAETGEFFVYYTVSGLFDRRGRVSRFNVDPAHPERADAESEEVVLEVDQPWSNHNGGQVAFGPDGHLYLGLGDGGAAGDPAGNAQNRATLLGAILRLDVSARPYAIPPDNPFAGNVEGWREEIYAYGLRNPWRLSFDPETGWLWTGDVGQNLWEEVDVVERGRNYGWDCREGYVPYMPRSDRSRLCADAGELAPPVWAYGRELGISVTGGYVYRGRALPDLVGHYVYGDYGSGRVWALFYDGARIQNTEILDTDLMISSFGVDEDGEIYVCDHHAGGEPTRVYRLAAAARGEARSESP